MKRIGAIITVVMFLTQSLSIFANAIQISLQEIITDSVDNESTKVEADSDGVGVQLEKEENVPKEETSEISDSLQEPMEENSPIPPSISENSLLSDDLPEAEDEEKADESPLPSNQDNETPPTENLTDTENPEAPSPVGNSQESDVPEKSEENEESDTPESQEEPEDVSDFSNFAQNEETGFCWNFNNAGDAEGWYGNLRIESTVVQDGCISFVSLGNGEEREPSIYSPEFSQLPGVPNYIDTEKYNILKIRIKNQTTSSKLYFYYRTTDPYHTDFNSNKRVTLPVKISNEFIEYTVDFRKESKWRRALIQFMITMGGASGTLSIDSIKLEYKNPGWNFENSAQGWSGNLRTANVSAVNGVLSFDSLGNADGREPALYSPKDMPIDMDKHRKMVIRLKNQTDANMLYLYYSSQTPGADSFHSSRRVSIPIRAQSDGFEEYIVQLESESLWSGTLNQLMLTWGGAEGHMELAEVRFEQSMKKMLALWDFEEGSLEGWRVSDGETGEARHSISIEDGCLKIVRNATGAGSVFTPDGLQLPADNIDKSTTHHLVLEVKRASGSPSIKVYFKTEAKGYSENDVEKRIVYMHQIDLEESNERKTYVIDLAHADPAWRSGYTGTIDELMFEFTGAVLIDKAYITEDELSGYTPSVRKTNISVKNGEEKYVLLTETYSQKENGDYHFYTIEYDPQMLEISDSCALTWSNNGVTVGKISGTDLEIVYYKPGKITYKVPSLQFVFIKRIFNIIKFTALADGETQITLSDEA